MKKRYVWIFLSVLFTMLIFARSMKNAADSSAESSIFVNIYLYIYNLLFSKTPENPVGTVRKLAHVAEFAIQGVLLCGVFSTFKHKIMGNIFSIMFLGLLTACVDEFLQLFSDGRAGLVTDIFIDFGGTLIGILISLLFVKIICNLSKQN